MKTLELREGKNENTMQLEYVKVTNPANPNQFIYVEKNVYAHLVDQINQGGLSSFLGDLWKGVQTVVGGIISTTVGGVISGVTGRPVAGSPTVATSPQANGQPTIVVTGQGGQQYPATILPQKDNTILWVGGGLLIGAILMKMIK